MIAMADSSSTKIDFSFSLPASDVLNQNWIASALFCTAQVRNGMRWRFMEAKGKIQKIVGMWIEEAKPAPFPIGLPLLERFTVTGPMQAKMFDPVNFHPTEKVAIDVLVKHGLLSDDNGEVIPKVEFLYGGRQKAGYTFRVELEALS